MSGKLSNILAGNLSKKQKSIPRKLTRSLSTVWKCCKYNTPLLFLEDLFASFFFLSFVVSQMSELYRTVTTITSVRQLGIRCTAKDIAPK